MAISIRTYILSIILFMKKYYNYILLAIGILISSFCISLYNNIDTHFQYMNYLINENIIEYEEIDLEHICTLTNCDYIYMKTTENVFSVFKKEKTLLYENDITLDNIYKITDNIYNINSSLLIFNEKANLYVSIKYKEKIYELFSSFLILFFILLLTVFYLLFNTFKKERNEAMLHSIGNEAILANKSMVIITENIHHELNTPIEVIDNKITKIHNTLKSYMETEYYNAVRNGEDIEVVKKRKSGKKITKLDKDFEFLKISIEQIFSILNKMKNFKSLRYSNGNKTIYDIIDGAFRIILVSNSDFDYKIDIMFKKYKMSDGLLKNVDLLNVLINHIKNSIEANGNFIEVKSEYHNIRKELKIKIKDNGSGIPPEVLKHIFQPNFSTKNVGDSIRGNGMYLNKYMLQQGGGDVYVEKSITRGNRGTIVTIKISAEEIFNED